MKASRTRKPTSSRKTVAQSKLARSGKARPADKNKKQKDDFLVTWC